MNKFIHDNKEVEYIKPFIPQSTYDPEKHPRYYYKGVIGDAFYWFSEIESEDIILTDEDLNMIGRIIPQIVRVDQSKSTLVKQFFGRSIRKPYAVVYNEK